MKPITASLVSFALAVLVPTSLVVGLDSLGTFDAPDALGDPYFWLRFRNFAVLSLFVSLAHVVLLGLPAFLFLRHLRAITWYSSAAAGFVLACIPIGLFTSPPHNVSDLLNWLLGMVSMGLLGMVSALSFWLVWRRAVHPNNSSKADASGAA